MSAGRLIGTDLAFFRPQRPWLLINGDSDIYGDIEYLVDLQDVNECRTVEYHEEGVKVNAV